MSDLLTIDETAELTTLAVATLRTWRWRDRGEGPRSFRVGGRVRYRRSEVERWLREQEAASTPAGAA